MKFKSALVTQASGSLGGMTASHNQGGLYLRARSVPVNPSTSFQQAVRNALAQLVTAWVETLTPTQRDSWRTYSQQVPLTDPLGDPRMVGAVAMYVRSNVPRLQSGELDSVDQAPSIFDLGTFTEPSAAFDLPNQEADITFDNTDAWANEDGSAMLVYISPPQNPSVNFFKGPYRLAGVIEGDGTTAPTSPAALPLPFAVFAGQRVFFQVRVSRADGRLSSALRFQLDAAT